MTEPWIYDVLRRLLRIEETHAPGETCVADILDLAPMSVRDEARAIESYLALREPPPTTYPACSHRMSTTTEYTTPCEPCSAVERAKYHPSVTM